MACGPLWIVKPYLVAPDAESDLKQIWRYLLGKAALSVANRIQSELVDAFESLADVPGKGHTRPDLTAGMCSCLGVSVHDRVPAKENSRDRRHPAWQV